MAIYSVVVASWRASNFTIFPNYVNSFVKIKQEPSEFLVDFKTEEQKQVIRNAALIAKWNEVNFNGL